MSNQRKIANQNKLRKDRKDILNKIGFVWSTIRGKDKTRKNYGKHDELWDQMYVKLTKYKEENGHCLVPYNYKIRHLACGYQLKEEITTKKIGPS